MVLSILIKRDLYRSNIKYPSIFRYAIAVFLGFLISFRASAEGSKELNPNGGHRVYLYTSTTTTGSLPWANQGLVRVYVQAGETINVGSSVQGLGDGTIILVSPNGNTYTSGTTSTTIGRISTRAQEMAGPSPNVGGYTPYTVTAQASEAGVWCIFFVGSNGTNNGNNTPDEKLSTSVWDQPNNSPYIAAFDVSVRNVANTAFIPGRAYMNLLEGTMGDFDAKFTGKLNVLTNDGYIYEVNANGLAGNAFAFFSNNKGFKSGANPSYLSQDGTSVATIHPPLSEDTTTDITHKLFFNTPAADLPASAPARTTTGLSANTGSATTTWLKTTPVSPTLTNFSFVGKEGTANQAGAHTSMGGYFNFDANQTGNYSIKIDANKDGDFTDASDRIITNSAVIGSNTVFLDGLDGAGTPVTGSFSTSNMQVILRAGEVHFPLLDVENNPSGIIIIRTNGVGAGDQTVYWNDSNISSTSNPSSPLNTSVNGVSSATNGHKWGSTGYNSGSFGNDRGLDTWTYVFSTPIAPSIPIQFLRANLEVLPITKSKITGICIGQQQTYTVSVRNNGPSAATEAKFNFTFPAELTGVVVTPVLTSGTASVASSNIVGSQYNASLNMNNGSVLTFTITGTVSSLPAANTLSVKASVMRPADVYDPDATNPDAAIPTDAQAECDSAPSGLGCNNIQNDSTPVLISNLSIANVSEAEGSGGSHNMTFTVTASPANASCDITVDYALTHVTTNSADFAGAVTGTVTIPAGQASKTFLIPIVTDQIIEANETFTLTLSNPSSGGVITTGTATGTITDDDNIPVNKSLVITPTDGAEGVSPGATFAIGFPTGITADKDTEIAYTLTGTATGSGTDYTGATSGTIIIPALTNSVTITLPVIDDVILEGTETIIVTTGTITTPYTGISVSNSPVTLNIADDDNAILISGPAQVVEGNAGITYVTFRVSLDITTSSSFTIDYLTEDGVATSADNDYVSKSGTLTFTGTNPGEYFDIQIAINGDVKIEGNESFKVKLQNLSNDFGGLLTISGSPATMSILDDDNNAANKTITITKVDGAEAGADAEFIFSFPSGVSTDAATTINYTLSGVAVANGTDYNGLTTGTVTIAAGANSAFFSRSTVDDLIIEDSEAITITTGTVTNSKYNGIGVSNSPFSLNIIDNDNTVVNNTITLSTVLDGSEPSSNGQFRVSYPAGIVRSTPTTVNYSIAGTATNGTDYTTLSGSVIIPANSNSAPIDVSVTDDQIIEATETVSLTLTSATSGSVSLNVSPAGAQTINITDNDNIPANNVITLTRTAHAEEGLVDGQFKVSFPLGYVSSVPTTVNYVITGTATNGTDYTTLTGQVIIPAGSNSANIDIIVTDDLIIEATETISLGLSSATNSISALSVNPLTTVTADLRDNDNVASNSIITLTKVSDGAEPGTNVQFLVSYPAGVTSAAATTVNYLISGTAVNGTDYAALGTSVVIPAGANSATITPVVSDDQLIEATETIVLTLTTATNSISVPGLTVNPITGVSADIIDDDNTPANTKLTLTKTADGAEPGTKAQFTLSYPSGITNSAPTIVNYIVSGTATNGTDYTVPSITAITTPANTNSVVIDVTVSDDFIIEPTETVTVDLITASSSTISTITLDPVGAVSADIADNDNILANKTITITKVDGVEGMLNGSFMFSFPLGITASAPTEISFYLTGTADGGGTDYTASPSPVTITIPAGQNSATLNLMVLEDDIIENIETVTITTTAVTNADLSGIVVGNSPQTLNISDNDDYTTLSVGNATVTEGNSGFVSVNFTVTLEKATGKSFSVKYTTEDGTATTAGNDYLSKQDVLNFSGMPGESFTVSVQVKGDLMIEMNETFKLKLYDLSDSFGGRLTFANSTATGTITDDDLIPANVNLTVTPSNGSETGPISGIFTFSFPTGVSADAPTTVNFGLSGLATSIDYTGAGTSSVTIPAGDNSFTLTLPVIDDVLVENTETIVLTTGSVSSPYGITVGNSPQSVEIADNDNATISISGATVAEGNSGTTTLSFTLTLDKDTGSPFTVNYATTNGTATILDNDYAAASGTLSFNGTAGSQTIEVTVKGDQKVEPDEILSIAISNLSNTFGGRLTIPVAGSTATGTITNDDSAIITITSTDGMEAGTVSGTFTFSFPAGVKTDAPTTINYTLSGTAESGDDYTGAISGSVTIPAGENSVILTLPVIADLLVEDTETVVLTTGIISSPYGVTVGNSPHSLNIIDKDQAVVSLTGPATITEGDNGTQLATYTVTLNQATAGSFTVDYATSNGTATLADNDYESSSGRLTFAGTAGETETFTVEINGDQKIEADQNFSITLSNLISSFSNRPVIQGPPMVTSIVNDDSGIITITPGNGSETGPVSGTFTFSFPAGVSSDAATTIYVGLTGTALGTDYTGAATSSITIPAGDNGFTLTLPVIDDALAENTETIVLTTGAVSSPYTITVANSPQSLDIADNDNATLSIASNSVLEGNSGTATLSFTVTLDKDTGSPFTVDYATANGTATVLDTDYTAATGTLTFNGTAGTQTIVVAVKGDQKVELDENFTVTLSNLSSSFENRLSIPVAGSTATGTITNDDSGVITITKTDGAETGAVPGKFTFSFPAGVTMDAPTTINYTLSGTAESGKDYTEAISGSVTIPATQNSIALDISVTDDAIVEDTETVILTAGTITSPYSITVANSTQSLNIIDNDQATVTLTGQATITEGQSGTQTVTYTATLDKATQGTFTVDYATVNGTATLADNDYESSSGRLTFAGTAGETQTFTVVINGDQKIEADQDFSVTLSNLISSFSNSPVIQTTPVVTSIENDDSGVITITSANGSETGPVSGTFTFSFPADVSADAPTTINFGLSGTATGVDYTGSGTSSVTIPTGDNSITLTLPVINDVLIEGTETIVVTTSTVNSPYGITVANSPQSLNIADNDNATLVITGETKSEGDAGSKVLNFTVTLDKETSGPFTIDYITSDGTATVSDNDYTAKSGTVSFTGAAGESRIIEVSVTGDKKIEADENLTLTLSNLSNNYNNTLVIDGSPATGIISNDDTGVITIAAGNGSETGPATGTFTFSFPTGMTMDAPTTINYTLSGTAESAKDYTGAISGSVIIAKDENSITLTLPVTDDALVEDTETIILNTGIITSPYTLTVTNSPQSLNITDNDQATVTLTGLPTITEGDNGTQLITYTATLDKATHGSFTVDYATANGTATIADNDYESSSGTLTFAGTAGETETFTALINGDQKIEADENFSVTLSNLISSFSNSPVVQSIPVVTTIENDDSGVITITSANGSETGPVSGTFTFSFPTGVSSDAATTINFGLSGTATGIDYNGAGTSSITIPAGDNSFTLTLPVIDDLITEGKETVTLNTGTVSSPYGITVTNSMQSFEIADNDNASLSISGVTVTEGNSGTTAMNFTVTLDKASRPFSVNYATADGTATTATNDYVAATGTLNFAGNAGESQTITVTITGDGKVEADETLSMTISDLSDAFDGRLIIATNTATGTITNDDSGVISITSTDGMEAGPIPGTFTFSFPAGVTVDAPTTISYTLSGTAESVNDYTAAISGSITIPANTNSVPLSIPVISDLVAEDTETVILTTGIISSPYTVTVGNSPQSLNIIDKDQAVVSLTGPATITEGQNGTQLATYTVTLNQATAGSFTVDYATSNGTATLADNDYESSSGTLTFAGTAGETETFTVQINGDQTIEADQNFSVTLSNLISSFSNRPVIQGTPVVTSIVNDDSGAITITSGNGSETGPVSGTFTFSFPAGVSSDAATTIYFGLTGTATGADYTGAGTLSITIPANANSAELSLGVNDDLIIEGTETVILTTGAISSPYGITVTNSPQSLNIADNDNATLSLAGATVTEGNSGTKVINFTVTLDKATSPFSVDYTTTDGTATIADNDYNALSGTLNFVGTIGESKTVAVTITGDNKIEADESFTMALSNLSNHFNNSLVIDGSPTMGIIGNDDTGVITVTPGNGSETGTVAGTFTFSFPAGITTDAPTTINYTLSGTAESTKDYTGSISGSVIIPKDANSIMLTLPVTDDALVEDIETIILSTGIITSPYTLTVANSPQSFTITDNDQATVTLTGQPTITEGNNGSQLITYTATLDKATQGSFTVDYATANGTASNVTNDYNASSGSLTFAGTAGETETFTVQINGDQKIESDETFSVSLSNLSSNFNNRLALQSSPVVTSILNDDSGTITITSENGSETGPIPGSFSFSFPTGVSSDAPMTINFGLSGTATGTDYTGAGTSSVTIPAGDNSIMLTLPVIDDALVENTETIVLTTGAVSSPYGITVANSPQSLDIADNDNATLSISGATVAEGNSGTTTLSFTVTLDKDTGLPFTVDYATSNGTATVLDTDYTAKSGTLSFNGTAGSQTIVVTVKGDQKVEPDEILNIAISNLSSSFGNRLTIPAASSTATGTITNDDSGVITITSTDGMEAGPIAGTFTFSFPAGVTMDTPTTINYTLSGTAESGDDYTGAISGSVTIPAGDNSITLTLPVIADLVVEDTETVILTTGIITSPYTVTVGNSPQSLNIIDKDQAVLSLTGPATITEGDNGSQLATYTVTLNQATAGSFTVDYATSNGTATLADNDYESSSGTLEFAGTAGETETFTVQINGDLKIEADENFSVTISNLLGSFSNLPVIQAAPVVTSIKNDDSGTITITSSNGSETGPVPGTFTFSFPAGVSSDAATVVYFGLTGTATGADYSGAGTLSVTIPANANSAGVVLSVNDDLIIEGTETVVLTTGAISSPYGITVANTSQSLNIADNDNATLSLAGATITEGDSGTKVINFTVTLDKATSPFSVDYATSDGTATISDNDYVALSGTLNFAGTIGESKTVAVTITGDKKIEADESFTMTLSNLSDHYNNTLVIGGSPAMGIIGNDDTGVITITPENGSETGPTAGSFTFSLPAGTTTGASITINYTLSGTAESAKDYTGAISGSVIIDKDQSSTTLTLPVTDDALVEDTETIILSTGIVSSPYTLTVANSPQSLTISDNDQATVTLTGQPVITEGNTATQLITYTATLDKATQAGFTVDYATANGSATIADNDYESSNSRLTFAGIAGETKTFTVQINGDGKIEADENFSVTLSNLISSSSNRPVVQSAPVVTSIENDDSGTITITSENGSETGPVLGSFSFSFPTGVSADAPTTINFGLSGTAAGTDYTGAGTNSITIPAGDNSFTLSLPVIDDTLVENTETVILTSGSVSSPYGITVANSPQSLEIADNDNATLTISGATVTEGNSGTTSLSFTVTLDKATGSPFTVDYATSGGTATAGNDYTAKSGTLSFNGTAGSQTIVVSVTGDQKIEPDESFNITISNLSSSFGNRLTIPVASSTATGTITNDDSGVITITSTDGMEAGPVAGTFTFSFPAGVTVDAPTTISYTLSGTAESVNDYTGAISGSVTIPINTNSITLTLPVIADLVVEDTETVILTTGIISSPYGVTVGNSPHSLNIIDKDQAVVALTGPATITEGQNGTQLATYTVTLNQATAGSFTVDYATSNGTATLADNDYESSSGSLTFAGTAGETETFTVQINGDQKIEADENFSVTLSNLISSFSNSPVIQTTPVVTSIENDDSGAITITSGNGSETGPVPGTFTFSLPTGVSSDAATVIYYGLGGTASSSGTNYDYTPNPGIGSITIPANTNSVTLTLNVNDDLVIEGTETVILTAGALNSPYDITVANSPQSLDIADNDNAILSITGATVTEGNSGTKVMSFTVTLNKATSPFSVDYTTKDGTATIADNDYSAISGTLNFAGSIGESKIITISIIGDQKIEANENLTLELSNLSNNFNNTLAIGGSPATGTIIDDDNTVNNKKIIITTVNGAEGGANASMEFSFPDGVSSDGITTIPYTLGGTARDNGTDYNISSTGILYIPAGENSVSLPLVINDDPFIEGTETAIVNAGIISNDKYTGLTLSNAPQTIFIADNDVASLSIAGPVTITEGNNGSQKAVFNVMLDKATGSGFSISYSTADGTALASDNDYIAVPGGTVVFEGKAGEVQKIEISIIGDKKIELNENYQVRLTSLSSDFGGGLTFGNTSATGTILDDDNNTTNREITITKSDGTEGAADGSFTFSLPAGITLDAPTTVNYTLSGTARGAGVDYNNSQVGSVVIAAGENYALLTIDVVDDSGLEPSETVIVTTGAVTNNSYNGITVLNSPHALSIEDDDNASISISGPIQVTEGNAGTVNAVFRVALNRATGDPFTVNYTTKDGTATVADNDYIASSGTLTFLGTTGEFVNITVPVKGDLKIEKNERFTIELSGLSNDFDQRLAINGSPAVGTIRDDDNTVANRRLIISKVNGAEGGNDARFKFSFQTGVSTDDWTTVNYVLSGTALGDGVDYASASTGSVTIPPGENSVVLDLSIIDDAVIEATETVILTSGTIENNSHSGITTNNSPLSLNITDNDEGELKLSGPVLVQEGNSGPTLATFSVTLLGATGSPFSIGYATFDGTAKVADNDYVTKSANLNFQGIQGEVQTITILVNGDYKIESDEEFNLILRNLSNTFGDKLKFSGLPAKGRILNDDNGTITITKIDGEEGADGGSFTFNLSPGVYSDRPIIIPYNLSGTATGNTVDYLLNTSGSITIPGGQSKVTLNLVVNDDDIIEPLETVKISTGIVLSSMPNAVLVDNSPLELAIKDNDTAPIIITNPVIVKEGNSGYVTMKFSATLPLRTASGFTFDYATADSTATVGDNDYIATSGRLTFAGQAGEVQNFSVLIKGDLKAEADEKYSINLTGLSNTFEGRLTLEFPAVSGVIHDDDIVPMAIADIATTPEDTPVTFSLIANDSDIDGIDPTSITIKTPPAQGEVKVNRDGTVTYTPALNVNGTFYFTYSVKDLTGLESNDATVTVIVTPANDAPIAEDDSFYALRGGTLRETVSTNDSDLDGDLLRFKATLPPTKGTLVSFNESDGSFIYTPLSDTFTGFDEFTYQVIDPAGLTDDAIVTIGIQPKAIVKLTPTLDTLREGEPITVTAVLSEPLLQDVDVVLEYNGDAELDKDYTLSGDFTSFTIKAGDTTTTQELILTSLKDYLKEGDEIAGINIASATPSLFVEIESGTEVTITEVNPEEKPVGPDENGEIHPDPYSSPDGDGLGNESFVIHNIDKYPDNEVIIFNRWGNEVFRIKEYNNKDKAFTGVANSGLFANKGATLPDGVYYFIIHTKVDNVAKMNKGYVIIRR